MNKTTRNYYVDVVIGVVFVITAISALIFLVPLNWIDFSASTTPTVLGIDFGVWQLLHTYSGIAMLVGVVVHLVLHWTWIVKMTGRVLPKRAGREQPELSNAEVI